MGEEMKGKIIDKNFQPPMGSPTKYWCFLIIETDNSERVTIRLHHRRNDKFVVGDMVRFSKPWRRNKPVKDIQRIS
jgi:hypothetical protein